MIKCPVCDTEFIPKTFYPEETIFTTTEGKSYSGFDGYINLNGVKPPELILGKWVTYCTNCNYVLKFVKEIVRQEKIKSQSGKGTEIKSKYNNYYYGFPFGDYNQYLKEITEKVKDEINLELHNINFEVWENLYKVNDNFKFLVRFFANLEKYCNSSFNHQNGECLNSKIEKLNLPKDMKDTLLKLNTIREEIIHGDYEISPKEEEQINQILIKFIFYLINKHVKPIITQEKLENGYDFIELDDLKMEIKEYLANYLYSSFNSNHTSKNQIQGFMNSFLQKIDEQPEKDDIEIY